MEQDSNKEQYRKRKLRQRYLSMAAKRFSPDTLKQAISAGNGHMWTPEEVGFIPSGTCWKDVRGERWPMFMQDQLPADYWKGKETLV